LIIFDYKVIILIIVVLFTGYLLASSPGLSFINTSQNSLVASHDGGGEWFVLSLNSDHGFNPDVGEVSFVIDDNVLKEGATTTTSSYNDGVWHHALGKREGTNIELWVDGQSRDTEAIGSYGDPESAIAPRIGSLGNQGYLHNGNIDNVIISGEAWPDAKAKYHYYEITDTDTKITWSAVETESVSITQPKININQMQ